MHNPQRIAVFPGTFDPFTRGHENIARKALQLFEQLYIAIGINSSKSGFWLSPQQRQRGIAAVFDNIPQVHVITYAGLTVDLCHKVGARFIVRGVRNASDWNYEWEIALSNRQFDNQIETVILIPDEPLAHIRSTIVREIARNHGPLEPFIPTPFLREIDALS